jgi:hypothetical protein
VAGNELSNEIVLIRLPKSYVACEGVTVAKVNRGTLWVLKPAHRTKVFPTALIIAIDPSSK